MIDLTKVSGLPIELTDDSKLKFNAPLTQREPDLIRKFSEVREVLLDPTVTTQREDIYWVYRHICLPEDENEIQKARLTCDITIVPPLMLGEEFNKTVGHYHGLIAGTKIAHPELYEILHGQATLILQKMDLENGKLLSVLTADVKAGDKIIYPPNYGHILINTGLEPLVTANWLALDYKALYEPVKNMRGMSYYLVSKNGTPEFVKNEKYEFHPELRKLNTDLNTLRQFGIDPAKPIYTSGTDNPGSLEFLTNPQKYQDLFDSLSL